MDTYIQNTILCDCHFTMTVIIIEHCGRLLYIQCFNIKHCSHVLKLHGLCIRVTSHTRLRAHDHYTSSTLIGGKGGAGPGSLHTYA